MITRAYDVKVKKGNSIEDLIVTAYNRKDAINLAIKSYNETVKIISAGVMAGDIVVFINSRKIGGNCDDWP